MYLTQTIRRAQQINANGLATTCAGRERTWRESSARIGRLAGALRGLGVGHGDRCAILSLNSDRYFEFMYAVPWAGAVIVPINIRLAPPEVAFWLNDSGTEILFVDDTFVSVIEALRGKLETVREVVFLGEGTTPDGMHDYEAILEAGDPVEDAGRGYDDLAAIYYTGGTTGRSKGVMLSHRNMSVNNLHVISAMPVHLGMRWLHVAPMFHIADALSVFVVTQVGGTHVFIPGFTPEATLEAIAHYRITTTLIVPTMVNMLVNHPDVERYDLSSLEGIIYGASPMPEAVITRAIEVIPGCGFTHAYGMTEAAPLLTWTPPEFHALEGPNAGRFRSAGRAIFGVDLEIVDDNGVEVPRATVGEVRVRGGNIMLGYWNQPELTAAAIRDGWYYSGDGAYMDEEGFIYIVDRMKDMIITGGENVYSTEVEDVMHQHPAVAECAVIGIPDETWGEAVHAIVRLVPGQAASAEDLIAHCRELIAGYKCPRSVAFRDASMPLSGAGKILKTELRKPFWEGREKAVG